MNRLLLTVALLIAPAAHAAAFLVSVNTSTLLPSTAGVLVFDYSTQNAQSSFAAITNFAGATQDSVLSPTGTVSGDLGTNDLVITATNPGSSYATNATFNNATLTFHLSLYGPAIDTPDNSGNGTTFSIQLYTPGFLGALLTVDGTVGLVNIAGDGTITTDGLGFTTFTEDVPEPATYLTMAAGVALLALNRRRRA